MQFSRALFLLVGFLILGEVGMLCAQTSQLHFQHFTTEDGLPSSETYVVFEDSEGYIWIGTDNGVARYDGYEFEVFDSNDGLGDVVVFTILEDHAGRIWVGTYSGGAYYFEDGKFHAYRYNDEILAVREKNEFIHLIDVQENEEVVFRLSDSGLFVIGVDGEARPLRARNPNDFFYYTPSCKEEGRNKLAPIKRRYPKAVLECLTNEVITRDWGIIIGNESCQRHVATFTCSVGKGPLWPIKFVSIISNDNRETVYFLYDDGLWASKIGGEQYFYKLSGRDVNCMLPSKHGELWVGSIGGGGMKLLSIDSSSLTVEAEYLRNRSVSHLTRDRRGGMWIATTDAGIYYCAFPSQQKYTINPDAKPNALAVTGQHSFYVGYSDASFYQNERNHNKRLIVDKMESGTSPSVNYLFFDEYSKKVYSSHFLLDHFSIEKRSSDIEFYFYAENDSNIELGIRRMTSSSFLGSRKGLVANIRHFGIINLEDQTTEFVHRNYDENMSISAFFIDVDGRYLLGTLNGLMEFDPKHPDSIVHRVDFGIKELNTRIVAIEEYNEGVLFGTRGDGVVYLKDGQAQVVKEKDGLASDMVRDVEVSDSGEVWVSSLNGLSKISFEDDGPIVRTFRVEHGLINNEIHDLDIYGNDVWIATSSGVQKFIEPPLVTDSNIPKIRRFIINGDTINVSTADLDFDSGEHNVSIFFSTINLALGDQINYRYRLGENTPWVHTNQRTVTFPQLGAGDYHFSVASQNEDQIWSEELSINFSIAEYWYKTWPALLGGLLLFAATISFYFILRERRNRKEQDLLLQINQLEHEALHAQMNPHFVFNALNSIQNFVVHNDAKQAATYLSRFALVVRQTLNSSVKGQQTLVQEINMLETYLSLEKLRFKEAFRYEISLAPDLPVEDIVLPPLLIQPFVENAILHGLKEIEEGGLIQISFSGDSQLLKVEIEDNGIGFEIGQEQEAESLGMDITRRRLAMLKGASHEKSKMEVEPIYNAAGRMKGTKVVLRIYLERFLGDREQTKPENN